VLPAKFSAALLVEGPALVLADVEGNVAFTDGELRVALQHRLLERAAAGSRVLLARSRQSPPLMVLCGREAGGVGGPSTAVVKTWVGSKLAAPSNVIDVGALLKQQQQQQQQSQQQQPPPHSPTRAALAASSLEPTALACNHDGTKIVVGFKSGAPLAGLGNGNKTNANANTHRTSRFIVLP
jgi:hypothetical protein